jgi:DNA-binding XRE family transcriptional regulator
MTAHERSISTATVAHDATTHDARGQPDAPLAPLPPPPGSHELGRTLRRLRRSKGLTIETLAFSARLHPTYLSGIERGERNPTWAKLCSLAYSLDTLVSVLVQAAEGEAQIAQITHEVEAAQRQFA